jgi:hypothetical protein
VLPGSLRPGRRGLPAAGPGRRDLPGRRSRPRPAVPLSYVRYNLANVGTEQQPIWLLLETTYAAGSIERHCYQLDEDGGRREVASTTERGRLPPAGAEPLARCSRPAIDRQHDHLDPQPAGPRPAGERLRRGDRPAGRAERQEQPGGPGAAEALDPKMVFPEEAFDEQGNIRSDYEAFPFTDPEKIPKYITWNAELAAAMQDRAFILNQLLVRTETSPPCCWG